MYDTIMDALKSEYAFVKQLKRGEDTEVLVYRHKESERKIVVKKLADNAEVYQELRDIRFGHLPVIYEVAVKAIPNEDGHGIHYQSVVLEEFIDGMSVGDVLTGGLYTEEGMIKVVLAVCDTLKILHARNIIHRDIKPENIMLNNDGVVKLIDYNAAKIYKPFSAEDTVHLGTNGYAAPEQYGITQSDQRSDIYAIGILMNVMLTGEHPSTKMYGGKLGKIINKCIQVNRKDRFQNVDEVERKLLKCK